MSAIDKLIAAMQRTQLSYQRLARSTPVPSPETDTQRGIATVLGDMIRLAAELRAEEVRTNAWKCLGCEEYFSGRHFQDSSGNEPFCGPCLGITP